MLNAVRLLEALGRNPELKSAGDFQLAVATAQLEPAVEDAVLRGDAGALNRLLGGRPIMMCNVVLPDNDEPQREDEPDGDDDTEAPERESLVA